MKPNPLMAAIFAIILLLTFVVVLRSAVGAPEVHEAPHATEETHTEETGEKIDDELHKASEEEHEAPQEEAAH